MFWYWRRVLVCLRVRVMVVVWMLWYLEEVYLSDYVGYVFDVLDSSVVWAELLVMGRSFWIG